jgi:hypothetical protein
MMYHAHQVLATPTHHTPLSYDPLIMHVNTFTLHNAEIDDHKAATIYPDQADCFTFFVTSTQSWYAQMANDTTTHYTLQSQWNTLLSSVVPSDSIVRGFVYLNHENELQIGLFDILRNAGLNQTHKDVLSRHALLHSLYYSSPRELSLPIKMHWIGFESVCLKYLEKNSKDLPFKATSLLRIQNDSYMKVLPAVPKN